MKPLILPMKQGVGASRVQLPSETEYQGALLIDFLANRFVNVTHAEWLARFERGDVLNEKGEALAAQTPFRAHDTIHYYRHVAYEPRIPFEVRVVHADEHLVVADKPHFLPVTPSGRYVKETLLARLKAALNNPQLAPLHRLDRDTAGLVMLSAQPATRGAYHALFSLRRIIKIYEAIAAYQPNLKLPMRYSSRLERADNFMQMSEVKGLVNSHTDIALLEVKGDYARYELRPITGKRHQLRAHMLALGVSILNDGIYPVLTPEADADNVDYSRPLQLLAKRLEFTDPLTQELRSFHSEQALKL